MNWGVKVLQNPLEVASPLRPPNAVYIGILSQIPVFVNRKPLPLLVSYETLLNPKQFPQIVSYFTINLVKLTFIW